MIVKIGVPDHCRCLLKPGSKINLGEPYLERKIDQLVEISVTQDLKIQPKKIFQHLKKFVGDDVKKGQIIALKKDLFGQKKLFSPVDGTIKEIDHGLGKIIITINQQGKKSIASYFKGEVVGLKSDSFELEIGKAEEIPLKKITGNFGGKTYYLDEKNIYRLLNTDVDKKIVIAEQISDLVLSKIEVLDSAGLIALKDYSDKVNIPFGQIENLDQFQTIINKKLPYCLIVKQFSKIYFYH